MVVIMVTTRIQDTRWGAMFRITTEVDITRCIVQYIMVTTTVITMAFLATTTVVAIGVLVINALGLA